MLRMKIEQYPFDPQVPRRGLASGKSGPRWKGQSGASDAPQADSGAGRGIVEGLRDVPTRPGQGQTDWALMGEVLKQRRMENDYVRPGFLPDREERLAAEEQVRALNGERR